MNIKEWIAELEARKIAIGTERDRLDDAIAEMHDLRDSCREAWDALEEARDALSRLV